MIFTHQPRTLRASDCIGAGAAGAFIISRAEIADALGGVVLVIIGLGKSAASQEQLRFRRRGLLLFVVCLLLVAIPLSLTAYENITGILDNNTATVTV